MAASKSNKGYIHLDAREHTDDVSKWSTCLLITVLLSTCGSILLLTCAFSFRPWEVQLQPTSSKFPLEDNQFGFTQYSTFIVDETILYESVTKMSTLMLNASACRDGRFIWSSRNALQDGGIGYVTVPRTGLYQVKSVLKVKSRDSRLTNGPFHQEIWITRDGNSSHVALSSIQSLEERDISSILMANLFLRRNEMLDVRVNSVANIYCDSDQNRFVVVQLQ